MGTRLRRGCWPLLFGLCFAAGLSAQTGSQSGLRQTYTAAEAAFKRHQWDLAQQLFEQVLAEAYGERGRLLESENQFAAAVGDLEWAGKLRPRNFDVEYHLALAYSGNGQYESAEQILSRLQARRFRRADVLAALGRAESSLGKFQLARKHLQQALLLNPADHLSAYTLGLVLLAQKDVSAATRVFVRLQKALGDSARWRLLLGRAYFDNSYNQQAEVELRRALALDPGIHFAHHLLALCVLRQDLPGAREEAQRHLEVEISNHPGEEAPVFMLGVVLESRRDWAGARSYLDAAQKLAPEEAGVYLHRGHVELEAGDASAAAADLEHWLTVDPDDSAKAESGQAHFLLSRAYLALGQTDKSLAEAKKAQSLSSEHATWEREKMAQLLSPKSSLDSASNTHALVNWTELQPPNIAAASQLKEMYTKVLANSHDRLAIIAANRNNLEEAVRHFERVSQIQPNFPGIDFNLGLAAFRTQRLAEAVAALQRAAKADPANDLLRQLLGRAEFEYGDCDAAIPDLEAALTAQPDDPGLLLSLGTCLGRANRESEAELVFARLLKAHANSPELHMFLAQGAYAMNRIPDARTEFNNALLLDPHTPDAHFYLGMMALPQADFLTAEREFRAELESYPGNQKVRYHLAFALLREQKRDEAMRLLEEVTQAAPGYAQAHYSFGKTLVEEGQLVRGIAELEEAVRDDPGKAYSHYQLGRAYMRQGKLADARRELELAAKLKDEERNHQPAASADPDLRQ